MKYIRTKDGRIVDLTDKDYIMNGNDLILHEQYDTVGGLRCKKDSMIQASIAVITKHNEYKFVGTIEKQADTIEELCDGICAIERNGKLKVPYAGKTTQDLKVIIDLIDKDNYEIYGAVWCEWGLKFVARMNSKGELELL